MFQGLYPPPREDIDGDRVLTGDSAYKAKSISGSGHISNRFRLPLLVWVSKRLTHSILRLHLTLTQSFQVSLRHGADDG